MEFLLGFELVVILFLFIVGVLYLFLPFAIFGIKPRLKALEDTLLRIETELREANGKGRKENMPPPTIL